MCAEAQPSSNPASSCAWHTPFISGRARALHHPSLTSFKQQHNSFRLAKLNFGIDKQLLKPSADSKEHMSEDTTGCQAFPLPSALRSLACHQRAMNCKSACHLHERNQHGHVNLLTASFIAVRCLHRQCSMLLHQMVAE